MPNYPKLKFEVNEYDGEQEGVFVWGNARQKLFEKLYEMKEYEEPDEALSVLEELLEEDPEFIDALGRIGWWELQFSNFGNAFYYFSKASEIGDSVIPNKFHGKIRWGFVENRPYLKTMQGLGLSKLFMQEWQIASEIFDDLLNFNPDDNQGIRALAIHSFLAQGKFKEILKLIQNFTDDTLPDTLYGAVYANYRLDNMKEAEQSLITAIKFAPNVAKELVKKSHKKIDSDNEMIRGGEEEALDYWGRVGQYWTDPKLLKIIRDGLKKNGVKK